MTHRFLTTLALAASAVLATAGAALAVPLVSDGGANLYPGFDNNVATIGYMAPGVAYEGTCNTGNPGWCIIRTQSGNAYVERPKVREVPGAPTAGFPGITLEFGFGNNNPPRPGRPDFDDEDDDVAEVCFYTNSNFRGRSLCVESGDASNRLNSTFNDAISSIEVPRGVEVEVCTDRNMRGTCALLDRDSSRLPSRLNDRISSFEVY
jgi:hypothetical protein